MQESREHMNNGVLEKFFGKPQEFDQRKMEELLEEPDVVEVNVFKATPINLKMAELRHKFPNKTRRELRAMLKGKANE